MEKKLKEADSTILVFGHPRGKGKSAWNPIDLKLIPGEPKTSSKGTFEVRLGGSESGETILTIGPEPRPFENLRAADMDDIADQVLTVLAEQK